MSVYRPSFDQRRRRHAWRIGCSLLALACSLPWIIPSAESDDTVEVPQPALSSPFPEARTLVKKPTANVDHGIAVDHAQPTDRAVQANGSALKDNSAPNDEASSDHKTSAEDDATAEESAPQEDSSDRQDAEESESDPGNSRAYGSAQEELKAKLNRKGKLTLRDATLNEALFAIREHWDISLVFGNDLQGEVNAVFPEQPLHQILDTLLFSRGYGYRIVGASLVIMKREDIKGMDPLFETVTVPVKYGEVSDIENAISQLGIQSPNGKLLAIPAAKAILIMDYPENIQRIRKQIESLEREFKKIALANTQSQLAANAMTSVSQNQDDNSSDASPSEEVPVPPQPVIEMGFFKAYHVSTEILRASLQLLLSEEGTIQTMEKENRIVVLDYPQNLERVRLAIKELDLPRPQVRIWALIYDASLDDVKRIGVNWNGSIKGRNLGADGLAQDSIGINTVTNTPVAGTPNGGMTFMSLNTNFDVTAVVNMLSTSAESRLLANPNVIVVDKEPAKISIVREIPYQQLTQGGNSGGPIGTTAFRDAGVTLDVTPKIADNGWIEMTVKPTFSLLTGSTQQGQPIIDKREAQTTVWVPNGETFVIGGLRQRQANHEFNGIPGLKDMRFGLSHLFRNRQSTVRESELLVFITPVVITPESKQFMPREACAFDYGRYMLGRMPCPTLPPEACAFPGPIPPHGMGNSLPTPPFDELTPDGNDGENGYGLESVPSPESPRHERRSVPATQPRVPDVSEPQNSLPDISVPDISVPDGSLPDVELPKGPTAPTAKRTAAEPPASKRSTLTPPPVHVEEARRRPVESSPSLARRLPSPGAAAPKGDDHAESARQLMRPSQATGISPPSTSASSVTPVTALVPAGRAPAAPAPNPTVTIQTVPAPQPAEAASKPKASPSRKAPKTVWEAIKRLDDSRDNKGL